MVSLSGIPAKYKAKEDYEGSLLIIAKGERKKDIVFIPAGEPLIDLQFSVLKTYNKTLTKLEKAEADYKFWKQTYDLHPTPGNKKAMNMYAKQWEELEAEQEYHADALDAVNGGDVLDELDDIKKLMLSPLQYKRLGKKTPPLKMKLRKKKKKP